MGHIAQASVVNLQAESSTNLLPASKLEEGSLTSVVGADMKSMQTSTHRTYFATRRDITASKFFRFDELTYYRFGLQLGIANILRNGFRLGPKKTIGKILQPINSYTRFPEYHFVGHQIEDYVQRFAAGERPRILDVGSPKCFGLYLAFHFDVEVHLTDIDPPSVEEAELLWNAVKRRAKGKAIFSVQDARAPKYSADEFDIVYSMSVIEHIEGATGDSASLQAMLGVLKPGGLLLVTVPLGEKYTEQDRMGLEAAARVTDERTRHFFQRIYTPVAAQERIVNAVPGADLRRTVSVWRKPGILSRVYRHLGPVDRGLLGCFNPLLSATLNDSREGMLPVPGEYSDLHSATDTYGDLMLAWVKSFA